MFVKEPKTSHDAITPLIYFNCFAGITAFRQPNQSDKKYLFMKLYTAAIILINWTSIYTICSMIWNATNHFNTWTGAETMRIALAAANSFTTVIAPFLVWLRRKGLRDCMQQVPILDETFHTVLGAPNEYRKHYIYSAFQVTAIVLVMIIVSICDTLPALILGVPMSPGFLLKFITTVYVVHQPILVMFLLDVNFCTFVGYLRTKFEHLNDSLLRLTKKPLITCPSKRLFVIPQNVVKIPGNGIKTTETDELMNDKYYLLREIRKAHLKLCKLSRKINLAFGIQNLLSAGVSFAMITGLLYDIYCFFLLDKITLKTAGETCTAVLWTAIYIFKIWMVNHSCWGVSNEAEKTGEVVYELLTNSRVDKELTKEIHEFGIQMLQNPVRFDACRFFTLDHTFVQGVIGSITTYLIILIQMSHLSGNSVSETDMLWNKTEQARYDF